MLFARGRCLHIPTEVMAGDSTDNTPILPARRRHEELPDGGVLVRAPAKINLNLLVGPRRGDGFHSLDSLAVKVTLYDSLRLRRWNDGQIELNCEGFDCGPHERNLALLAARELLARSGGGYGARIELVKHIAPGGGLGGGSSDAAAVLWGLNRLWSTGLTDAPLRELAAGIGSDVPLFLGPPAARMTGRGECLEAVDIHDFTAVIFMPGLSCPTPEVYAAHDCRPPRAGEQLKAELVSIRPPSAWRHRLRNDLLDAACEVCPELADLRDRLARATSVPVCLTGAGSAMFLLCDDTAEADAVMASLDPDIRRRCVVVSGNPW